MIAKSDALTADRREWLIPNALKRGEIYSWTVTAMVDGREVISPGPSAPEMKFQILSTDHLRQLNQQKKLRSTVALGIFYVKTGLIGEAKQQFRVLVQENPKSEAALKLLRQVRTWQKG